MNFPPDPDYERDGIRLYRGDARELPLEDGSVDLIVTSPPYFAQRSYRDGGDHYAGQIGSEPTPGEFLDALWDVTEELWRVLSPTGSLFVNLGDKRSGSGAPGTTSGLSGKMIQGARSQMAGAYSKEGAFGRPKSKMLLPHRYAIGVEDGLADPDGIGWIVRQDLVWEKANGLPESVQDRTRDAHEYWFHLTKEGDYYSALDEIREPLAPETAARYAAGYGDRSSYDETRLTTGYELGGEWTANPLGRIPASVWRLSNEPLVIPDYLELPTHTAAFPTEWPRRLILAFSPPAICLDCGEGRRPVSDRTFEDSTGPARDLGYRQDRRIIGREGRAPRDRPDVGRRTVATILGYACSCSPLGSSPAPSRPAVVLDPFGGTGTTALVARALGRSSVYVDLSADYLRLAKWRIWDSGATGRIEDRTLGERQGSLL